MTGFKIAVAGLLEKITSIHHVICVVYGRGNQPNIINKRIEGINININNKIYMEAKVTVKIK